MLFKRAFPKGDLGQVSFAVSGMYLLMLLVYWPVPIILNQTGVETYDISKLPYQYLIGSWSSTSCTSEAVLFPPQNAMTLFFFSKLHGLWIWIGNCRRILHGTERSFDFGRQ
jgi:hypothetical protein